MFIFHFPKNVENIKILYKNEFNWKFHIWINKAFEGLIINLQIYSAQSWLT